MMEELSLHILDLARNSIKANSSIVEIEVDENIKENYIKITIIDDGCGMNDKTLKSATDPFYTTRTTRDVGLGISLFKLATEMCDGDFNIKSSVGKGTTVSGKFVYNHINRVPLGDIVQTVLILTLNEEKIDILYRHIYNGNIYVFNTQEIREVLGKDVDMSEIDVMSWIKENITVGINELKKQEE